MSSRLHVITNTFADVFINGEYRGSKDINIEATPGTYSISFGDVVGYVTPLPRSVIVDAGYETLITVEYIKE